MRLVIVLVLSAVAGLASLSVGQWQQQPQVDQRTGPIYPPNPAYDFHSRRGNYDPFQFNWYSGQWDYFPVPFSSGEASNEGQPPYVYNNMLQNWNGNLPEYAPVQTSPGVGSVPAPPPESEQQPIGDLGLWGPTSRPEVQVGTQEVKFCGKLTSMRTIDLMGVAHPQLLLRLVSAKGAKGTVDAGDNLQLPPLHDLSDLQITATGKLGMVDGNLVLFADKLEFGNTTVDVKREATTQPSK